jgi:hypothetical protein
MDLFLKNIDPIVVKKIDEIEKKKRFLARTSLKVSLVRREVLREGKDYDKERKEKSQNRFTKFFARNSGAHSKKTEYNTGNGTLKKAKV